MLDRTIEHTRGKVLKRTLDRSKTV